MNRANNVLVSNDHRSSGLLCDEQREEFKSFWDRHRADELRGRDRILASFCPQMYGLYAVKLALAVVLCGGVEREDDSGTRVRGEPHMVRISEQMQCMAVLHDYFHS